MIVQNRFVRDRLEFLSVEIVDGEEVLFELSKLYGHEILIPGGLFKTYVVQDFWFVTDNVLCVILEAKEC